MFRSFRSRLTLFFVAIVIVPMLAVTVALFRLISDNEHGQADARVAQAQTAAIGLYGREVERAGVAAGRVARDPAMSFAALRSGNERERCRPGPAELLRAQRLRRIAVVSPARTLVDVGSPDATASAARTLRESGGGQIGQLRVSATTATEYTRLVRRVTGLDAAVQRGGRTIASTVPSLGDDPLPRVGTLHIDNTEFRAASFTRPRLRRPAGARRGPLRHRGRLGRHLRRPARGRDHPHRLRGARLRLRPAGVALAAVADRRLPRRRQRLGGRRLLRRPCPPRATTSSPSWARSSTPWRGQLESRLEELRRERARLQECDPAASGRRPRRTSTATPCWRSSCARRSTRRRRGGPRDVARGRRARP